MNTSQCPTHTPLHTSSSFNGYPVQNKYQPLMESNLQINELVLMKALSYHKRTCALRFDLKLPLNCSHREDKLISKFFDSLRARIKTDIGNKNIGGGRNKKCTLSYLWVNEVSRSLSSHFHVVIFLNLDIYNCFGSLTTTKGNMFSRIKAAWASALGLAFEEASGLIHVPDNAIYKININADNYVQQVQNILYRLSYFAKVQTKPFGEGSYNRFLGYSSL